MESDRPPPPTLPGRGLLGILALVVAGFLLWRLAFPASRVIDPQAAPRVVTPRGDLSELERATIELYRKVSPSVVHVANVAVTRDLWTRNLHQIPRGTGSGFVWDARGYIVTNEHVVRDGNLFLVTFADHETRKADLVGTAPDHDLAVLLVRDVPEGGLVPVAVGTSQDLQVGQSVFVIGNPFGLDQTLTTGVIGGLDREIRTDSGRLVADVVQTDAAINPGNSGGPLLDSAGRVIGITTAIVSRSGTYSGVGFAVPVDTVNRVVPVLIRGETLARPGLGIRMIPRQYLLEVGIEGAGVLEVEPGSAAEKAGLRGVRRNPRTGGLLLGDVIVAVDGQPVRSQLDLLDRLQEHDVGDEVTVTVVRGGSREDLSVRLQAIQ